MSLSVLGLTHGQVFHYRVGQNTSGVFISQEYPFPSLKELVAHHKTKADGLIHPLKVLC